MTYYMVLIQREPGRRYQVFSGWDEVYTARPEAEAALARALRVHHDAQLATATAEEAEELGWFAARPCSVITYQHAYDSRRSASLCRRHDHDGTRFGARGPVLHGEHVGSCDACWAERADRDPEMQRAREVAGAPDAADIVR